MFFVHNTSVLAVPAPQPTIPTKSLGTLAELPGIFDEHPLLPLKAVSIYRVYSQHIGQIYLEIALKDVEFPIITPLSI